MVRRLLDYVRLLAYLMAGFAVLVTPYLWDIKVNGVPAGITYGVIRVALIASTVTATIGYLIGQGIRIGRRSLGKRSG